MKLIFTTEQIKDADAEMLLLPIRKGAANPAFQAMDKATRGALSACAKQEKFTGQPDRTLIWQGTVFKRSVKIMGVGIGDDADPAVFRLAVARGVRHAAAHSVRKMAIFVDADDEPLLKREIRGVGEAAILSTYRYTKLKSRKPRDEGFPRVCAVGVFPKAARAKALNKALQRARSSADAVVLARDLVNEPANLLSPEALGARAERLAQEKGLSCTVLDAEGIRDRGMALFLSVAAGSTRSPRFIHLTYTPKKRSGKPVALIGKGVTFDSGGLCLKPGKSMYGMKTDMSGAATVLGVMSALEAFEVPFEVHGIIPATDNSVGGDSTRPGDVFKALSGTTVEVINTDAEGRLILADALTYACELKPRILIDHATLTGACEVALGSYTAGLFSKRDKDADAYLAAARRAGELMWRLPLSKELEADIKSDIADLKNTGQRWGGAITAALFLQHFTGNIPWIHLDIAGPARADRNTPLCPKGGTGFGVLTALTFLSELG